MTNHPTKIVFDVGNVLIEWDMFLIYQSFFADRASFEAFAREIDLAGWNLEQDRGRPWADAEALLIADFPQYEEQIRAYRSRWHEMIPGVIAGSVLLKEQLSASGVPLYAITNFAADTFAECQERFPTLKDFIDIVISGEEKIVKPDLAIFELFLNRNGLEAQDCLFIDDSEKNIVAAKKVGMHAHHFTSPEKLEQVLRSYDFPV
jgi:2-haloacid dehalogenase